MKKIAVLVAVVGGAYLFFDFQSVKQVANKALKNGTLQGVVACVQNSQSDLVTEETTRNACSSRFQTRLYNGDFATGLAGPSVEAERLVLNGTLKNKETSHITTWVELGFFTYDAEGKEREFSTDTWLWIEPRKTVEFSVALPDVEPADIRDLKFCDHDDKERKSCFSWGVMDIHGLRI